MVKAKHARVFKIQSLVKRSPPQLPSSLKCEEGKTYNEKMQFEQIIIHNIYISETSTVKLLHRHKRGWNVSEQEGPIITLMDLMNIELESKEDEVVG
jgi:hypothetical protein